MTKRPEPRETAERHVKDIRRKIRRKFSSEEKIRIVLEGPRGEYSIAELCRREGIWLKRPVGEMSPQTSWILLALVGRIPMLDVAALQNLNTHPKLTTQLHGIFC